MKDLQKYIEREPELEEFNMFFVNVLKDGKLIHSGLIESKHLMYSQMREIMFEAAKKGGLDNIHTIEHAHATWDYVFDPDNRTEYDEKYAPPFSGEVIRYTDNESSTKQFNRWKYLGPEWIVHVHEVENRQAFLQAERDYQESQKALLEEFKAELLGEAGLKDSPKKDAIWNKAVMKFGTQNPQNLEKIREFVKDVADLA